MTEKEKKYIKFSVIEEKPKTTVYRIQSIKDGDFLGKIFWYGRWRQYIFEPENRTAWTDTCLEEVLQFLKQKKKEMRNRND